MVLVLVVEVVVVVHLGLVKQVAMVKAHPHTREAEEVVPMVVHPPLEQTAPIQLAAVAVMAQAAQAVELEQIVPLLL
jgi:hypothetical protein